MFDKLMEGISAGGLDTSAISLAQAVAFITCIRGTVLNLQGNTNYSDKGFSWFSQGCTGRHLVLQLGPQMFLSLLSIHYSVIMLSFEVE